MEVRARINSAQPGIDGAGSEADRLGVTQASRKPVIVKGVIEEWVIEKASSRRRERCVIVLLLVSQRGVLVVVLLDGRATQCIKFTEESEVTGVIFCIGRRLQRVDSVIEHVNELRVIALPAVHANEALIGTGIGELLLHEGPVDLSCGCEVTRVGLLPGDAKLLLGSEGVPVGRMASRGRCRVAGRLPAPRANTDTLTAPMHDPSSDEAKRHGPSAYRDIGHGAAKCCQ